MTRFTHQIFSADQIQAKVKHLAQLITSDQSSEPIEFVGLMNGALVFFADLIRHLDFAVPVHTLKVQSYDKDTQGKVQIAKGFDPKGKRICLVDDILDSGNSLIALIEDFTARGATEILTCVLLDKGKSPVTADYIGFECPDLWVVGYGMDYHQLYRNLPFIAELPPELR